MPEQKDSSCKETVSEHVDPGTFMRYNLTVSEMSPWLPLKNLGFNPTIRPSELSRGTPVKTDKSHWPSAQTWAVQVDGETVLI